MSTVTVPNLLVGDSISSNPINTFIGSINGFKANADSFKPEGIDRRNLQPQITHDYRRMNLDSTVPGFATPIRHTSDTFTKLVHGSFNGGIRLGRMNVKAGEAIHVCASFNFTSRLDKSGNFEGGGSTLFGRKRLSFALGYTDGLGTPTSPAHIIILRETRRNFSIVGQTNSEYIINSNCCTLEYMTTFDVDKDLDFRIMAKGTHSMATVTAVPTITIDALNFFYVRYLV